MRWAATRAQRGIICSRRLFDPGGRPLKLTVSVRHLLRRLVFIVFFGSSVAFAQPLEAPLNVTIQADDATCEVTGKAMPCDVVPDFLLGTLRIPLDRRLVISLDGSNPTQSRGHTLAKALNKAGFGRIVIVGFISAPDHGDPVPPVTPANPRLERP